MGVSFESHGETPLRAGSEGSLVVLVRRYNKTPTARAGAGSYRLVRQLERFREGWRLPLFVRGVFRFSTG